MGELKKLRCMPDPLKLKLIEILFTHSVPTTKKTKLLHYKYQLINAG